MPTLDEILKLAAVTFSPQAAPHAARLFSTKLGPTAAQMQSTRARGVIDRVGARELSAAQALGDAAGVGSPKWLASRSNWPSALIDSPSFDRLFEASVKSAAAKRDDENEKRVKMLLMRADDALRHGRNFYSKHKARGRIGAYKKFGMELAFDTPEQAQRHAVGRGMAQGLGGALGGLAGARMSRGASPGARILSGLTGAAMGAVGGGVAADSLHDIPQRTVQQYDATQQRLRAAGGVPAFKFADLATELMQAISESTGSAESPAEPGTDEEKRFHDPNWGNVAHVDGSGTAGGNMHTGGGGRAFGGV